MKKTGKQSIKIDLEQFKVHLNIRGKLELSLHFDSPSRRFYLAVIALIVSEMKRLGKITSIPMQNHLEELVLLNETVGAHAGSSERKNLLNRIYKKWKGDLSDLEGAPLFKVLGKKKEYDGASRKSYIFAEEDKDRWANLFEYKGSKEGVRLRFSIDKLGAGLDDIVLAYGEEQDLTDTAAWDNFIENLRENLEDKPDPKIPEELETKVSGAKVQKIGRPIILKRRTLAVLAVLILGGALVAFWSISFWTPKSPSGLTNESTIELPKNPSIAVLPFVNISGDPNQEYFCDGMTEDLITGLSKLSGLFVISRNSVFLYKGKVVKPQQVSQELGVRYVLEGSVRKMGDRVRITAQLVDATTGGHLWAERYDGKIDDIFSMQDDVTRNIIKALQISLTKDEQYKAAQAETDSIEAYNTFLKGWEHYPRYTPKDFSEALSYFKKAVEMDPDYGRAYAALALIHKKAVDLGWLSEMDLNKFSAELLPRQYLKFRAPDLS